MIETTVAESPPAAGQGSVAAVILNWNQAHLTLRCIERVQEQVDHVYVVDNGSHPSERTQLEEVLNECATLIASSVNGGYAAGCNLGIEAALKAKFDYVLVMNNDAFPDPDAVEHLRARLVEETGLGAVGPAVVRPATREVLHVNCALSMRTGRAKWRFHAMSLSAIPKAPVTTDYLGGEALLVRAATLESVGLFDERFFSYYEDVEWSVRAIGAGWRLEVVPEAVFEHVVGASSQGRMGVYYRARNAPLFLRIAAGRSRTGALALSLPWTLVTLASLLRRGQVSLAVRGVIQGWLTGATMSC